MEVRFAKPDLDRLETDANYDAGWPPAIVRAYRKLMALVWAAVDERDFYALKGLHFEKLVGRPGEHSMRLNRQYRLIVRFEGSNPKTIMIVGIEDYH